jgi:hypothetical protein
MWGMLSHSHEIVRNFDGLAEPLAEFAQIGFRQPLTRRAFSHHLRELFKRDEEILVQDRGVDVVELADEQSLANACSVPESSRAQENRSPKTARSREASSGRKDGMVQPSFEDGMAQLINGKMSRASPV